MSMSGWTITGFGVKEEDLEKASTDDKIRFIKTYLPKIYEEMQADGENNKDIDMSNTSDYLDFCKEWINEYEDEYCNMGFAAMFASAINEHEDGFDVVHVNGEYSDEASVLYEDRMPWEMSDRVRAMKADDMREIFKKYLDVLGITVVVERQSVEFYG